MKLFRLTKTRYAAEAWTGAGARDYGGRWNHEGTAMVYATGSASLAVLEVLVHMQEAPGLGNYTLLSVDVPDDDVQMLDIEALPENWDAAITPDVVQTIGDTWAKEGHSVALAVPSAILPVELNFLLNPQHPHFPEIIKSATVVPFEFDGRLFKSSGR